LMENSNVPARLWLWAAWQMTNTETGVSSMSLERALGISHTTAWYLLHKLRCAMDQTGRDRLKGDVEMDETFVGGYREGAIGRTKGGKEVVLVACERETDTRMGRIRLQRALDATTPTLAAFIEANIEPGSTVLTDGLASYKNAFTELGNKGLHYNHKATPLHQLPKPAHFYLPHVHRVASLVKRWIIGTHQGSIEGHHLQQYLDEFVFRFNRRRSESRGLLFWRLVCSVMDTPPEAREHIRIRKTVVAAADEVAVEAAETWQKEHRKANNRKASKDYYERHKGRKQDLDDPPF
jgi:transposase-like protein